MKKAGEVLHQRRMAKNLSLSQIAEITKIPQETLKALEHNQYNQLPDLTFSLGFVKNYARFLDLDPDKISALFKRSYKNYQHKNILPPCLDKSRKFVINPKLGWAGLVSVILLFVGLFIFIQLKSIFSSPRLELESPLDGQRVSSLVLIKGQTDTDTTMMVNGELVSVDTNGQFETQYELIPGENSLTFVATNRRGRETKIIRHLEPKQ
jgi:cytoskeletal protein RodZ